MQKISPIKKLAYQLVTGALILGLIGSPLISIFAYDWRPARAAASILTISEVVYDPGGNEPDGEWIEIYNLTRFSVDLAVYKLGDSIIQGDTEGMMRFPDGSWIAPGDTIIVANTATAFFAAYGLNPDYEMIPSDPSVPDMLPAGWSIGSLELANEGDDLQLLDGMNIRVDEVSWGISNTWFDPPVGGVPEGHSIERYPVQRETDSNIDWRDQSSPDPNHVRLDQITVYNPADSGAGSLRQAVLEAADGAIITFDPAVFPPSSPTTIQLVTALPVLTPTLTIDGSNSQVIVNGSITPANTDGLVIEADGCTVSGLIIQNFPANGIRIMSGVQVSFIGGDRSIGEGPLGQGNMISANGASGILISSNSHEHHILGNNIGVDLAGLSDRGNKGNGILIEDGVTNVKIGGVDLVNNENLRNIISGNEQSGIVIGGATTTNNMVQNNYIGSNLRGSYAIPNGWHGIELTNSAHDNLIGGNRMSGEGNLLSGNFNHGLIISVGAHENKIYGNLIGPDASGMHALGYQLNGGIDVTDGAYLNEIGSSLPGEGNVISGNGWDGIALLSSENDTYANQIIGNLIGLAVDGETPLPNQGDGILSILYVNGTRIEENTIGANQNNGIRLSGISDSEAIIIHNRIGVNINATLAVSNGGYGIQIEHGAHGHTIQDNTIVSSQQGGILIAALGEQAPYSNTISNNYIGTDSSGSLFLGNQGPGILITDTARDNTIGPDNLVAYNQGHGIWVTSCDGNTLTQNQVYDNTGRDIESLCLPPPEFLTITFGEINTRTLTVTGQTSAGYATIEFFTSNAADWRTYANSTQADASGVFTFTWPEGLTGTNLTATSTDPDGNTSGLAIPQRLGWTFLLYLNGDNNLDSYVADVVNGLVQAGPSPRANVLALVDYSTNTLPYSGTALYNLSDGSAITLPLPLTLTTETNMGDGQALANFIQWGRSAYPSHHTLLVILDHGGGWAPDVSTSQVLGPKPIHRRTYMAGVSGLSWDYTNSYDYLTSQEIRQILSDTTDNGADPLDVVFYDVCLMGMLEVAYQIKDYASFFASSQNLSWAPAGLDNRYVYMVQNLPVDASARNVAELIVQAYSETTPQSEHPFAVSAVQLSALTGLATAVDQLAMALSQTLTSPQQAELLWQAYQQSQKYDYDSDLSLENNQDGFLDLYDLATNILVTYSDPGIRLAAQEILGLLDNDTVIVSAAHQSGAPWTTPDETWDFDNAHGLSIYFPLGEDQEFTITDTLITTPTEVITYHIPLRSLYTPDQLFFLQDTSWESLISAYYAITETLVPTISPSGPVGDLLIPDITAPQSRLILPPGSYGLGDTIEVSWTTTETQSGLADTTLWYRSSDLANWEISAIIPAEQGSSAQFTLPYICQVELAVTGEDQAGNREQPGGQNMALLIFDTCNRTFLPVIQHPGQLLR